MILYSKTGLKRLFLKISGIENKSYLDLVWRIQLLIANLSLKCISLFNGKQITQPLRPTLELIKTKYTHDKTYADSYTILKSSCLFYSETNLLKKNLMIDFVNEHCTIDIDR